MKKRQSGGLFWNFIPKKHRRRQPIKKQRGGFLYSMVNSNSILGRRYKTKKQKGGSFKKWLSNPNSRILNF